MSLRVVEAPADLLDGWDDRVAAAPGGELYQTRMWGEFWREYIGGQPRFWVAETKAGVPAGMVMTISEALLWDPFLERPMGGLVLRVLRACARNHQVRGGPVVLDTDAGPAVHAAFAEHLAGLCRRRPPVGVASLTTSVAEALAADGDGDATVPEIYGRHGFSAQVLTTRCVPLDAGEEAVWEGLHRSARKAVRKAEREGIAVRAAEPAELSALHPPVRQARAAMGLRTYSVRNWTSMWRHLGPRGCVHLLVAEAGGRLLGVLGLWSFGGMLREFASVLTAEGRSTTAGDLLKWEAIRWGCARGLAHFDLAGLNLGEAASDKERGIARFKTKWGGRDVCTHALRRGAGRR